MSVPPGDREPTVIFLHIGKTGGSTLQRILYRQFPPNERLLVRTGLGVEGRPAREGTLAYFGALPVGERSRPALVEGHLIYGIHALIPHPATYITLLRDPVALTVSQHRYVRRTPTHPLHARATTDLTDLDRYVRSGVSLETDNSQTRAIAGDTTTPFGSCTPAMLHRAKRHLEATFSVVGITEAFDLSLVALQAAFGWSKLWYTPINVAPVREPRERVAAETLRFIREQNRFDLELHAWAWQRLRSITQEQDESEARLRRLRVTNAVYQPWAGLTYHAPRRIRDAIRKSRQRGPSPN